MRADIWRYGNDDALRGIEHDTYHRIYFYLFSLSLSPPVSSLPTFFASLRCSTQKIDWKVTPPRPSPSPLPVCLVCITQELVVLPPSPPPPRIPIFYSSHKYSERTKCSFQFHVRYFCALPSTVIGSQRMNPHINACEKQRRRRVDSVACSIQLCKIGISGYVCVSVVGWLVWSVGLVAWAWCVFVCAFSFITVRVMNDTDKIAKGILKVFRKYIYVGYVVRTTYLHRMKKKINFAFVCSSSASVVRVAPRFSIRFISKEPTPAPHTRQFEGRT